MKIRAVFLGTPEFACPTLDMMLGSPEEYEIVAVITQPDKPAGRNLETQPSRVKQLAEGHLMKIGKLGKKFPIYTPADVNSPEFVKNFRGTEIDIAVVVAFGQILKPEFLNCFRSGAVNVHASLLPRWRGAAPIQWALLNEDPVSGVTLQKIAPKLDSGDVIATAQVVLDEHYDAPKLYAELSHKGADLVSKFLRDYVAGKIKGTPQDESQVTIAPKIKKEQGLVDWNMPASKICAHIRALSPWPGVWTTRKGKVLKILRAKSIEVQTIAEPSFLIGADKFTFTVQCGENTALQVSVVQPESRARMPVSEYMKGYPFVKGDRLGQ